ncbi:TPA: hypothetical protein G9E90_004837 [Salmonella enterica]|nr:hypothetical protein [Salmonella enterica]
MILITFNIVAYWIAGGKSWSSTTSTRSMTFAFDMQEAVDFSNKYHKIQSPDG